MYSYNARAPQYCNGGNWVGMGPLRYVPNAVEFNDVNAPVTYDTVAAANGVASTMVTGSFWVRRNNPNSAVQVIYSTYRTTATNVRFQIEFNASNQLEIIGRDDTSTSGVANLDVTTAATFTDFNWHHILFSVGLSSTSTRSIYIDDALDASTWGTYVTSGQIDFEDHTSSKNSAIGATPGGATLLQGDLADFWLNIGTYTNFSVTANRRLFIDANHNPVYLGAAGATPTGTSPNVYLTGPTAAWNVNKGTGGGFTTTHSVLSTAQTQPGAVQTGSITSVSTKVTGNTSRIWARNGNYLYLVDAGNSKIEIVDVSNPASMSVVGSASNAGLAGDGALVLSGDGNTAYVCSAGTNGLLVFNVTTKASPTYVTTITGTGICTNTGIYAGLASSAVVVGNHLYVPAYSANTLSVFDITTPTAPVLTGQVTDATNLGGISNIAASGNYVYAITSAGIFTVVDVSNPAIPAVVGHISNNVLGSSLGLVVDPANTNTVYSGNGVVMSVMDTTTKTAPVIAAYVEFEDDKRACFNISSDAAGRRLYCFAYGSGDDAGMDVFDITTPAAPLLLADKTGAGGTICTNCSGAVSADGNYIFTSSYFNGSVQSWLVSACTGPNGWTGDVMYNAGTNHVLQYCDGAAWQPMGPVPGAGGSGCSSPTGNEGDTIYSDSAKGTGVLQYCDGANWILLGGANLPTSGLVGYWQLDEGTGTTTVDSSGAGNGGTLTGSPTWGAGRDGNALSFSGASTQYVSTSNITSMNSLTAITVAAWIKSSAAGANPAEAHIIDKSVCNGIFNDGPFELMVSGAVSEKPTFVIYPNGGTPANYLLSGAGTTNVDDGQWHFIVGRYDGAAVSIWVDGVQQNSAAYASLTLTSTTNKVELNGHCNGSFAYPWSGFIDEVRVYNRALTGQEIMRLYNGT